MGGVDLKINKNWDVNIDGWCKFENEKWDLDFHRIMKFWNVEVNLFLKMFWNLGKVNRESWA